MPASYDDALRQLYRVPLLPLAQVPTPVEDLSRLRAALDAAPRLLVKRDDALGFAFGGNKVRKLEVVAADACARGADTLVTSGGLQSNHARATAAAAARLGLDCVLVLNGRRPDAPTGNTRLDELLGAEIVFVESREARAQGVRDAVERLTQDGRRPYEIPIGASMPLGALAFVRAIGELLEQIPPPDVIVHATSSGGTQAGLLAGCELHGLATRVIGVSADEPAASLAVAVRAIVEGVGERLGLDGRAFAAARPPEIDDGFVGGGYGVPTHESREAIELVARTEAIFLDPTYTAKAMAGFIEYLRAGRFTADQTILFWHTGGQVGLLA
ncbi:MAG: D-cysteine desulfhydrase family protein [Acidobacteriota bacterium]|nr:D-cysteine desulfhydrase family protein [Acidobacteriota bacterium]